MIFFFINFNAVVQVFEYPFAEAKFIESRTKSIMRETSFLLTVVRKSLKFLVP